MKKPLIERGISRIASSMTPNTALDASSLYDLIKNFAYAYRQEPFTLASGRTSHHYFNCKKITLHPARLSLLCEEIYNRMVASDQLSIPEAVGGLTLGADPLSYGLSLELLKRGHICYPLIVRKEAKGHGTGKQIEGEVEAVSGKEVLALDDVITTGGSTLKAIHALREAGFQVNHALCIVDRQEGGKEALASEGVNLIGLFQKGDFIEEGMKTDSV